MPCYLQIDNKMHRGIEVLTKICSENENSQSTEKCCPGEGGRCFGCKTGAVELVFACNNQVYLKITSGVMNPWHS